MADPAHTPGIPNRNSSDYGSDFGENENELLVKLLEDIEIDQGPIIESLEGSGQQLHGYHTQTNPYTVPESIPLYQTPELLNELSPAFGVTQTVTTDGGTPHVKSESSNASAPQQTSSNQSPLRRFRTFPKKPLSVTDLVSPAWCELQYLFNLQKYGKVPATKAMRRGIDLHQKLEEEDHESVEVQVETKEDLWGVRIWNVIQGLRALRITGATRELEVWGVLDGEVVNGVIDELSYWYPLEDAENTLSVPTPSSQEQLPDNQTTLDQHFSRKQQINFAGPGPQNKPLIYLTDVKTRGHPSLPKSASLRPTFMQIMLYRKLLADLACGKVNGDVIFNRFGIDSDMPFSPQMIADVSDVALNLRSDANMGTLNPVATSRDVEVSLRRDNTVSKLWTSMIQEYKKVMKDGEASISNMLRVEFRSSSDNRVVGSKMFQYEVEVIDRYVADKMSWWRGEREAKGVDVEEAFKCRSCQHADQCSWRLHKIAEATAHHRTRHVNH